MTIYKHIHKIVYVEELVIDNDGIVASVIHHVLDTDMKVYLDLRKEMPDTVKLYDNIDDREQKLAALGVVV